MRERACCKRPGEGGQAQGAASIGRDGSAQELTGTQSSQLFYILFAKAQPPTTRPAASGATGHDWWHLPSDSKHASLDDVPVGVDVADEDVVSVALLVDEHVDELINATEASEPSGTQLGFFVCV